MMEDLFCGWETLSPIPDRIPGPPLFSPPPLDFFGLASTEEEKGWLDSSFGSFARWFEDLDPPQSSRPPSFEMEVEASMVSDAGASSSAYSPRSSVEDLLEELMLEREALENSKKTAAEPASTLSRPAWASWIQPSSFVGRVPAIGSGLHFLTARGRRNPAAAGTRRKQKQERRERQKKKGRRTKRRGGDGKNMNGIPLRGFDERALPPVEWWELILSAPPSLSGFPEDESDFDRWMKDLDVSASSKEVFAFHDAAVWEESGASRDGSKLDPACGWVSSSDEPQNVESLLDDLLFGRLSSDCLAASCSSPELLSATDTSSPWQPSTDWWYLLFNGVGGNVPSIGSGLRYLRPRRLVPRGKKEQRAREQKGGLPRKRRRGPKGGSKASKASTKKPCKRAPQ
ncbi:hypothetical protein QOT17_016481 [Balamuthia mandrillaris]